jgi:NAD(P)H-quinone oxidoreductase subunit 6
MLVNKRQDFTPYPSTNVRKILTAIVSVGLFALLSTMVLATPWSYSTTPQAGDNSIILIGEHFFSDFLLPFELASVLLLMAMVGAIILARREYLPEVTPSDLPQTVLTLPERPRELVGAGGDTQEQLK